MVLGNFSTFEEKFLLNGLSKGVRLDGRQLNEYRPIRISPFLKIKNENSHILSSCKVKIGGNVCVASVTADLSEPDSDAPDKGIIKIAVHQSLNLLNAQTVSKSDFEKLANFAWLPVLNEAYAKGEGVDLTRLCIIPSAKCWCVYIDVMLMKIDGNPLETMSLAIHGALRNVALPKVAVTEIEGIYNIEVDNVSGEKKSLLNDINRLPIVAVLNRFKVGDDEKIWLADASLEESLCRCYDTVTVIASYNSIERNCRVSFCKLFSSGVGDGCTRNELLESVKKGQEIALHLSEKLCKFLDSMEYKNPSHVDLF